LITMRRTRSSAGWLWLVIAATFSSCGGDDSPSGPSALPATFFNFVSDPGEYVGAGETIRLTPDAVTITAMSGCDHGQIEVRIRGGVHTWDLHLAAPGAYEGARSWPVAQPAESAIAFYGNGRACGGSGGRFVVMEAIFAPDGGVERFHATFEQKCLNFIDPALWPTLPALRGEVRLTTAAKHAEPFLFCR
jgi:hypothetical protein